MAIKNLGRVVGADGKSAFQIWLEQGNTGSEQDFLDSLKGDSSVVIYDAEDDEATIKSKLLSVLDKKRNLIKPLYLISDGVTFFTLSGIDFVDNEKHFKFQTISNVDVEGQNMMNFIELVYKLSDSGELTQDAFAGTYLDSETTTQYVDTLIAEKITGVLESDF